METLLDALTTKQIKLIRNVHPAKRPYNLTGWHFLLFFKRDIQVQIPRPSTIELSKK